MPVSEEMTNSPDDRERDGQEAMAGADVAQSVESDGAQSMESDGSAAVDGEAPAVETPEVADAEQGMMDLSNARWYAIHVYSGCEQKVLKNIQYRLEIDELTEYVARLMVPAHDVIEIKDGKKVQTQRNLMPGYVLIEMLYNDDVIDVVSKLANVAGFVGDGTKPVPLGRDEVEHLMSQTSHRQDKPKTEILFSKGEQVKIIEGPFSGFNGQVDEIDTQRGKLSVMVSIFGRQTAVELDVLQVDKL